MKLIWSSHAWGDYLYWQQNDRKTLLRINRIIKEIMRTPFEGLGSPKPLRHNLADYWSRRIDREHRIVYRADETSITIIQCRYHY